MKAFMETVLPYTFFFSMLLLGTFLAVGKNEPLSVRVRMGKMPEDAGVFIRRLAVYLSLFFLNILVVLHFLAWQSVLAAVILWMLAKDRKVLKELDYVLLFNLCLLFIFVGNMKRIDAVNIRLMELIQGRELVTGIAASQIISNVPAAILLSGFTDRYKTLLAAVNLGRTGNSDRIPCQPDILQIFCKKLSWQKREVSSGVYILESCFFDSFDGTCSVFNLTRFAMHRNTSRILPCGQ